MSSRIKIFDSDVFHAEVTSSHFRMSTRLKRPSPRYQTYIRLFDPSHSIYLSIYLPHSLGDRWGTTRPGNQHWPFLSFVCCPHGVAQFQTRPISDVIFQSFLCLPLLLPPRTVPRRTVLASPEALVTCSYHFILRLFTVDKSSS